MKNTVTFFQILFTFMSLLFIGGCNNDDLSTPLKVTTSPANSTTYNSVSVMGNVSRGGDVSEVGICWNKTGNPTRNDFKVVCDYHTGGIFFGDITDLNSRTKYFARAYGVIHGGKTFYGDEISFITGSNITTSISSSSITSTTATIMGTASDVGSVKEVGICWSSQGYPNGVGNDYFKIFKTACDYNTDGGFFANLTGLDQNTGYYVMAYVINEEGTFYGNMIHFTTNN